MIFMNKLTSVNQLNNIKQCPYKAYISQFNFKTNSTKNIMLSDVCKKVLCQSINKNLTKSEVYKLVAENVEDRYFITKQEKEVEVNILTNHIYRYLQYEQKQNRKVLKTKVKNKPVQINDHTINVSFDIALMNQNYIEVIKFKTGKTKLSYKARTEKNKPENDIELFLIKKIGEQMFSKYELPVVASYYHLKGKNEDEKLYKEWLDKGNDEIANNINNAESALQFSATNKKEIKQFEKVIKQNKDVLYFDNTEGNNIISFDYDKDLSEEIEKLLSIKLTKESEKCQSTTNCQYCDYINQCQYKFVNIELEKVKEIKKASGKIAPTSTQQEIVAIDSGNYRVNSVPGSGKSSVMVLRVLELLKKSNKLDDTLMITFTNQGCYELKEKIQYHMNINNMNPRRYGRFNIFTFNSFGGMIINEHWGKLGFEKQPELASNIDVLDIIKDMLIEHDNIEWLDYRNPLMNFKNAKGAFYTLLEYFNIIKCYRYNQTELISNILSLENKFKDETPDSLENIANKVFELYNIFNSKLKEQNLLQYQDQILFTIQLLENYPNLINQYGYKHMVVDEYQDTNVSQVNVLKLLKTYKDNQSLCIVGDQAQAIYSFNNTTPDNIINFHNEFDNVQDINMIENFRSTPQIVNLANELNNLNQYKNDEDAISRCNNGQLPMLYKFDTSKNECEEIAKLIQDKIDEEIPIHEISVIARTKKELLLLQEVLNDKGIPNVLEISEMFLNNCNVKLILDFINFIKNPKHDYFLYSYGSLFNEDISNATDENINELVKQLKVNIIHELEIIEDEKSKINFFLELLQPICELDKVAKEFIEKLNIDKFHTLNDLLNYIQKHQIYSDNTTIEKDDNKYNAVVLTTAHSSKGKEWQVVINTINEYSYENITNGTDEEERRLLFVSFTRAKKELYVTYNTKQDKARGKGKYCEFVDELNEMGEFLEFREFNGKEVI